MHGFDTQALADILYAFFLLLQAFFVTAGIWIAYIGFGKLKAATQLNRGSMGGGEASKEGVRGLLAALGFFNMQFIINAFGSDIFNQEESYSWTPITASSADPLLFVGQVIMNVFLIMGLMGISSVYMDLPKLGTGQISGNTLATRFFISILVIEIEWVNSAIAALTPFNPLGLFLPGSGVITL